MKLLIDTNVVLDYLGTNEGFSDEAELIFELALKKEAIELVSASAVTDIYYVRRRAVKDRQTAIEKLKAIRKVIGILPVTENDIDKAINRNWKDFEDAVQYSVAETNGVDYIISRDVKGFEEDTIPCYSPKEFLIKIDSGLIKVI